MAILWFVLTVFALLNSTIGLLRGMNDENYAKATFYLILSFPLIVSCAMAYYKI